MKARSSKRTRSQRAYSGSELHLRRVDHAKHKTLDILRRRVACYRRELERQVCEVNFDFVKAAPEERVEPHHFSEAIKALVDGGAVNEHPVKLGSTSFRFWSLAGVEGPTVEAILAKKVEAFKVFNKVEHTPAVAGYHAENVHHQALVAAAQWVSVGWKPGHKIVTLGGHALAQYLPGDIDLAGHHRVTGIPFVAQLKNGREWLYPPEDTIWDLFGAAAQLRAVPILIARRLPDWTFTVMKLVGGFAGRATKMILPPGVDESVPLPGLPTLAQALRALGFHTDVDFIDHPLARHRAIWTGALNDELADAHARFLSNVDQILKVAYGEGLARDNVNNGKLTKRPRSEIVDAFIAELRERYRREGVARAQAEREAAEISELESGGDPWS